MPRRVDLHELEAACDVSSTLLKQRLCGALGFVALCDWIFASHGNRQHVQPCLTPSRAIRVLVVELPFTLPWLMHDVSWFGYSDGIVSKACCKRH